MEGTLLLQNFVKKTMELSFGRSDYKKSLYGPLVIGWQGHFGDKTNQCFCLCQPMTKWPYRLYL